MNQDLRRKLDRITNILFAGGVNNPITYIEQISYFIYLKLLDERENEIALKGRLGGKNITSLYPGQAEKYKWSSWRHFSGEKLLKVVRDDVFPYMANVNSDNTHIAIYFRDAVLQVHDPNVLKQVIDEIDTINFSRLGSDVKGDIYEYMLTYLNTMEGSLLGQFRTPRQIRKMMVEMVDPDIGDTIYDPACGTGGFLIDALEHIMAKYSESKEEVPIYGEEWLINKYLDRLSDDEQLQFEDEEFSFDDNPELRTTLLNELKKENKNLQTYLKGNGDLIPNWEILEKSIYGVDVSRQIMRIATMNMVLHGIMKANIKRGNTLSEMGGLTDDDLYRKYKVILSNPPFAGVLPKESIRENLPTNTKKSELLFLAVMMDQLAEGGTCAVIVPEGLLFGSTNAHLEMRKKLIEQFNLLAVVSLPAGVFKPYAGVKTSILVFKKPYKDSLFNDKPATDKVWFYEIKNDGYDPDKVTGGGRPETPELNDIPNFLAAWNQYRASNFIDLPGMEGNTVIDYEYPDIKAWWINSQLIDENDYKLSASTFKPTQSKMSADIDPNGLINEIVSVEEKIMEKLNALKEDLKQL